MKYTYFLSHLKDPRVNGKSTYTSKTAEKFKKELEKAEKVFKKGTNLY